MTVSPFASPWCPLAPLRSRVPTPLWAWLSEHGSLTARLQAVCARGFAVRVLDQYWARPALHEADVLGLRPGVRAWIREVHLLCARTPWVFARTVIPATTLRRHRRLGRLGSRSLGSALFAYPGLSRGPLAVRALSAGDSLYTRAGDSNGAPIWGRRSVFRLDGDPLLVSEFFLPALLRAREAR